MNELKQVYLMGLIVGLALEIFGIASLYNFFINNGASTYFLGGIGVIFVGFLFIAKSIYAFIPIKQQTSQLQSCPHCGAIVKADTTICEKCKQQLE